MPKAAKVKSKSKRRCRPAAPTEHVEIIEFALCDDNCSPVIVLNDELNDPEEEFPIKLELDLQQEEDPKSKVKPAKYIEIAAHVYLEREDGQRLPANSEFAKSIDLSKIKFRTVKRTKNGSYPVHLEISLANK